MSDNLARILKERAERDGAALFCVFRRYETTETITFAQLYERSCGYAARYRADGVLPGDIVLVMLEHSPHLYYAFFGAILAGAIPSFMPFPSPKQRSDLFWEAHRRLFERIEPAMIVTYAENAQEATGHLGDHPPRIIVANDALLEGRASHYPGLDAAAGSVACLQHSSGTTGSKKGVMLTHAAIVREIESYGTSIGLCDDDCIASWLPLYHDMGFIACFMTSVVRGVRLVALDPFEWSMRPRILLDAIEAHGATLCWLPNFAFVHLANTASPNRSWNLSSMRAFINCSEPCKPRAFERFIERFASCGIDASRLQVCYAMAENVFAVTQTRLGVAPRTTTQAGAAGANAVISCGSAIGGVEIEVRDENGRNCPDGMTGEIHIRSPFLFDGYYRLPEVSASKFDGDWYRTGDLGFVLDRELYVCGRVDDLLAIAGRNYYAHEIEEIVSAVDGCLPGRCVALMMDDDGAAHFAVLAECGSDADGTAIVSAIRNALLERLGIVPRAVFPVERGRLIKTTSGKISRSANKQIVLKELMAQ